MSQNLFKLDRLTLVKMSKLPLIAVTALIIILAAIFFFPDKVSFLEEPAAEFNITIFNTKYEPSSISVPQGTRVQFNVVNAKGTGTYNQGITIDEYGINKVAVSETTPETVTFVADKKGVFSAYCGTCLDGPFGRDVPDKRLTLIVN